MNKEKSEFGSVPNSAATLKLTVVQKKDVITVTRIGDSTNWSATIKFDGSVTETLKPNNTRRSVSVQWTDNNQTLVETANMIRGNNLDNENRKTIHTWKLSDGAKTNVSGAIEFMACNDE